MNHRMDPKRAPPSLDDLVNDAVRRFEAARQSGTPSEIARFGDGLPEAGQLPVLRQLVKADMDYRSLLGEPIPIEEYRRRFPELKSFFEHGITRDAEPFPETTAGGAMEQAGEIIGHY